MLLFTAVCFALFMQRLHPWSGWGDGGGGGGGGGGNQVVS